MKTTGKGNVLCASMIKARLGLGHNEQFSRVLPELIKFGAFKPAGVQWRMYEDDFDRYVAAKKAEAARKLAERRAQ